MSEENQIYAYCSTHPQYCKPQSFQVSHRHRYTPPAVEADIIQHAEESTKRFKSTLQTIFPFTSEFDTKVHGFLMSRQNLLEILRSTPEVKSFLNYVLGLESEVETELEMEAEEKAVEEILENEVEETEEQPTEKKLVAETSQERTKDYDNLLDALGDSIKEEKKRFNGKSTLQDMISEYVQGFLGLVDWLVEQRIQIKKHKITSQQLQQLVAEVISCDVLLIADKKDDIGSEKSLVIPLDFSPLRISLTWLVSGHLSARVKNWNRMFSPPVFVTWKENIPRLMKPYRSVDNHPIMIRIPTFERDSEKFQEEVQRSLKHFQEKCRSPN